MTYNGVDANAFSPGDGSEARAQLGIAKDVHVSIILLTYYWRGRYTLRRRSI